MIDCQLGVGIEREQKTEKHARAIESLDGIVGEDLAGQEVDNLQSVKRRASGEGDVAVEGEEMQIARVSACAGRDDEKRRGLCATDS